MQSKIEISRRNLGTLKDIVDWMWDLNYKQGGKIDTGIYDIVGFLKEHGSAVNSKSLFSHYPDDLLSLGIKFHSVASNVNTKLRDEISKARVQEAKAMIKHLCRIYWHSDKAEINVDVWGEEPILTSIRLAQYCKRIVTEPSYAEVLAVQKEFDNMIKEIRATYVVPPLMKVLFDVNMADPKSIINHTMIDISVSAIDRLITSLSS